MIIDSSALLALIFAEPGYENVLGKLAREEEVGVGAPTLAETGIVLAARLGPDPRALLARMRDRLGLTVIPFTEAHYEEAIAAYLSFGKGRHNAALNFGDCMSYAVARLAEQPLLCVGTDFGKTDIPLA